jgi:hypothetical protein
MAARQFGEERFRSIAVRSGMCHRFVKSSGGPEGARKTTYPDWGPPTADKRLPERLPRLETLLTGRDRPPIIEYSCRARDWTLDDAG